MSSQRYLVVGGGPAGLSAALELARRGLGAVVVDSADQLGGLARDLTCKATTECAKCGACLVEDLLQEAAQSPLIETLLPAKLTGWTEEESGCRAALTLGGEEREEVFAGAVVAAGSRPTSAEAKSQYGYGQLTNVVTGLELEAMLRNTDRVIRPSDGSWPRRLAFVQCVGSRDLTGSQPLCSRICCGYALRIARRVIALRPETEITVFYMDIQTAGREMDGLMAALADRAMFIRGLPGLIRADENDNLIIGYKPEGELDLAALETDLVVLSVGLAARPTTAELMMTMNLPTTEYGFLSEDDSRPVTVAGTAGGPMDVAESIRSGRLAANRLVGRPTPDQGGER